MKIALGPPQVFAVGLRQFDITDLDSEFRKGRETVLDGLPLVGSKQGDRKLGEFDFTTCNSCDLVIAIIAKDYALLAMSREVGKLSVNMGKHIVSGGFSEITIADWTPVAFYGDRAGRS